MEFRYCFQEDWAEHLLGCGGVREKSGIATVSIWRENGSVNHRAGFLPLRSECCLWHTGCSAGRMNLSGRGAVLYTFHCIVLKCLRSGALLHGREIQCCCCAGPRSLGVRPYLKSWKATESLFLLHLHFSDVQHAWLKLLFYFFCGVCEEITWRLRSRAELDWPQVPQLI